MASALSYQIPQALPLPELTYHRPLGVTGEPYEGALDVLSNFINWQGRPKSTNIEDRRSEGPQPPIVNLLRRFGALADPRHYLDAATNLPGVLIPALRGPDPEWLQDYRVQRKTFNDPGEEKQWLATKASSAPQPPTFRYSPSEQSKPKEAPMAIRLGPPPPELAFPMLMSWKSGKAPGIPNAPGTDWDVPLTVGGVSPYAQGPLPPQPPVEILSNGEPRLMPANPQPRYVPPALTALQAIKAVEQPSVRVAGYPFGFPPQPGSYPEPTVPPPIDPRLPAMLRSLIPGHGMTTSPRTYSPAFDPADILRRSQGMPPIPTQTAFAPSGPTANGRPFTTDDAIRAHRMLRSLNAPTPQGLSGPVTQDYGRTQAQADEERRMRLSGMLG